MSFTHVWVLWLLPLALLAWLPGAAHELRSGALGLLPRDRASTVLQWGLGGVALLALAATLLALAGPYRPEYTIERVGQGAEIVLVLDRSRSMDQGFAGGQGAAPAKGTGPEALNYYMGLVGARERVPKGQAARKLLAEFAAKRPDDRFGMVVFSTVPMRVLGFTQKQEAIQAAIAAGNIGRGLSETNIALALESGLSYFEGRPYTGSRIVLLVSDGGDQLDPDARDRIRHLVRKYRVGLYWIYLRSLNSPGLNLEQGEPPTNLEVVPEYALHQFFGSLGVAYRAYEAENPGRAAKGDRRPGPAGEPAHRLPGHRAEARPVAWACGAALLAVLLMLAANLWEISDGPDTPAQARSLAAGHPVAAAGFAGGGTPRACGVPRP